MENAKIAYKLGILFEEKIVSYYRQSYQGKFGKYQIEVLDYLYEHTLVRGQDIAAVLHIPKQHVSKIILKFEEMGLIASSQDAGDKRAKRYYLTEQGKQQVEYHIQESNQHFEEMLEKLSKEERDEMMKAMNVVSMLLEKM